MSRIDEASPAVQDDTPVRTDGPPGGGSGDVRDGEDTSHDPPDGEQPHGDQVAADPDPPDPASGDEALDAPSASQPVEDAASAVAPERDHDPAATGESPGGASADAETGGDSVGDDPSSEVAADAGVGDGGDAGVGDGGDAGDTAEAADGVLPGDVEEDPAGVGAVGAEEGVGTEDADATRAESAPVESAPVESVPVESVPVESEPGDLGSGDSEPGELRSDDSQPVESVPGEFGPVEFGPGDAEPGGTPFPAGPQAFPPDLTRGLPASDDRPSAGGGAVERDVTSEPLDVPTTGAGAVWFESLDTSGPPAADPAGQVDDDAYEPGPASRHRPSSPASARPPVTVTRIPSRLGARTSDAGGSDLQPFPVATAQPAGALGDDLAEGDPTPGRTRLVPVARRRLGPRLRLPAGAARAARPAVVVAGVAAAVALVYVGAAALLADRVPFNTTVGGVGVGGLTSTEAVAAVTEAFADQASEPVEVVVGPVSGSLDPSAAGLSVDAAASVAEITGFTLSPARMWEHVVGAGQRPLAVQVDTAALESELQDLAAEVDVDPVEGDVDLAGAVVQPVTPAPGQRLGPEAAADVLSRTWLAEDGPHELPSEPVPPTVGQAAVDAAAAEAERVLSQDLTLTVGERPVVLPPQLYAEALDYRPDGAGGLELATDGERLREAALSLDPDLETAPVDAAVVLRDGSPAVVEGVAGVAIDPDELASAAGAAVLGDHQADVTARTTEPEVTTADAEALGIVEQVSTFSTPYPDSADRTTNLRVAAETINGMVIMPGEVFSLNEALGPRTVERGYRPAGVIANGRYSEGVGGGVSQVSTTLYNAAYFAGMENVDHKPHSFYISRYPEGREATLNWDPPVEMKFRNITDYGLLIEASVGGGQVTVSLWSTTVYEVESITSDRFNVRSPETRFETGPDCRPQSPSQGFDVTVTRVVRQDGVEVSRESQTTTYLAADRIVCGPAPRRAAADDADDDD